MTFPMRQYIPLGLAAPFSSERYTTHRSALKTSAASSQIDRGRVLMMALCGEPMTLKARSDLGLRLTGMMPLRLNGTGSI